MAKATSHSPIVGSLQFGITASYWYPSAYGNLKRTERAIPEKGNNCGIPNGTMPNAPFKIKCPWICVNYLIFVVKKVNPLLKTPSTVEGKNEIWFTLLSSRAPAIDKDLLSNCSH